MSLGEVAIIVVAGLVFLKPEDAPYIIKTFRQLRTSIRQTISEVENIISSDIDQPYGKDDDQLSKDLNFYLAKIAELEGQYEGDYSLQEVKKYYYSLLKRSIIAQEAQEKTENLEKKL